MKQHLINITAIIGYLAIVAGFVGLIYLAMVNPQ